MIDGEGSLLRHSDVVLDGPEDEGLEERVARVVGLDKQPQHLPLLALNTSLAISRYIAANMLELQTELVRER